MAGKIPLTRYRATKTPDGEGGITEVLGSAVTVWGILRTQKDKSTVLIDGNEDVQVGDVLVAEGAQYRVTNREHVAGLSQVRLALERLQRPIVPA